MQWHELLSEKVALLSNFCDRIYLPEKRAIT